MYTVLLVDDEITMLETLKNSIHWQQLGVADLLTASNGLQAMEVLARQAVNLVITDIKMPHMDGIALLKSVRSLYPDTHVILLSAYTEFEYARQAVGLGAENYLLKPLQKGDLEESIERALDNIYTNRKITQQLFRNNIFMRWAKGTISSNELADRANVINVNLYLPEYQVIILHKKQGSLSLSSYCQICVQKLEGSYDIHHFKDDFKRHVFVIGGELSESAPTVSCFVDEANRIGIGHLITLSIGSIVPNADSLSQSYQVAHSLLEGASLTHQQDTSTSGITLLQESQNAVQKEMLLSHQLHILFQDQENEHSPDSFRALADQLIANLHHQNISDVQVLLGHSLSHLFAQEFPNYPKAHKQLNNRIRMFLNISDLDVLRSSMIELLQYSYLLYRYYINVLSPVVKSAIHYIHTHYAESISIQEFCNTKKVSAPYLGHLFKRETGSFFNTYLTQYRISSSIPLLLDSDLKISDIALQVGFSSTNYYITCFKQQTGSPPIKYRASAEETKPRHSGPAK